MLIQLLSSGKPLAVSFVIPDLDRTGISIAIGQWHRIYDPSMFHLRFPRTSRPRSLGCASRSTSPERNAIPSLKWCRLPPEDNGWVRTKDGMQQRTLHNSHQYGVTALRSGANSRARSRADGVSFHFWPAAVRVDLVGRSTATESALSCRHDEPHRHTVLRH